MRGIVRVLKGLGGGGDKVNVVVTSLWYNQKKKTTNATLSEYYFQAKLNIKSYGKYTPYTS